MGAAESTPEVVEAKESPQNSEFDGKFDCWKINLVDLSAQDIESDEEEIEYEEPEDEGRDSPNSRISDLDWVNTLSLSQLQRLEEAISLQKSQKERVQILSNRILIQFRKKNLRLINIYQSLLNINKK